MTQRAANLLRRRAEVARELAALDEQLAAEFDETRIPPKRVRGPLPAPTDESRARVADIARRAGIALPGDE